MGSRDDCPVRAECGASREIIWGQRDANFGAHQKVPLGKIQNTNCGEVHVRDIVLILKYISLAFILNLFLKAFELVWLCAAYQIILESGLLPFHE